MDYEGMNPMACETEGCDCGQPFEYSETEGDKLGAADFVESTVYAEPFVTKANAKLAIWLRKQVEIANARRTVRGELMEGATENLLGSLTSMADALDMGL